MPPGFHGFDLIIILAIALLIFGPKKLPEVGSAIAKSIKEYRKSMLEVPPVEDEEAQALTAPASEAPARDALAANTSQATVQSQQRKE